RDLILQLSKSSIYSTKPFIAQACSFSLPVLAFYRDGDSLPDMRRALSSGKNAQMLFSAPAKCGRVAAV
ncbi:MAG: hypothetical protein LBF18_22000, partial [Pantoea sp.]|nr:hypothetical protein [Pantoea sp.]MBZ6440854.1 hypothetical protein [Pantoea sp.]